MAITIITIVDEMIIIMVMIIIRGRTIDNNSNNNDDNNNANNKKTNNNNNNLRKLFYLRNPCDARVKVGSDREAASSPARQISVSVRSVR